MATITIRLSSICSGGNHLTFSVSGAKTATIPVVLDDLTQPITDEDAAAFCKIIARMAKNGRTVQQAMALLQNGVMVTV